MICSEKPQAPQAAPRRRASQRVFFCRSAQEETDFQPRRLRVQFDLRNGSYLRQTINVSFEWLAADGTVTESQPNWIVTPLEPGALTTVTATPLKATSAECRLRLITR